MSYLGTGAVVAQAASPFAILTRSAVGTNVQMDQSSQTWVDESTREIEHGDAWVHGFIGTTGTTWLSPYGLTTTALTGRSYYGTGWGDISAGRAFCDDAFVGWGSNATWQQYPTTLGGPVYVDPVRSRINIVRMRAV